jgi:hypothetical protein
MRNGANPTASKAAKSPSMVEREVMCACYEGCLDIAIQRKWGGFSCRNCCAFQPLRLELNEWLHDSIACIALMGVAESPILFKQKPRGGIVAKLQRLRSVSDISNTSFQVGF